MVNFTLGRLNKFKFNKYLNELFQKTNHGSKETIIIGDINYNYLNKSNGKVIKELQKLNVFTQIVKQPTSVTDTSEILINVNLTTKSKNLTDNKVIPTELGGQDTVACRRKK